MQIICYAFFEMRFPAPQQVPQPEVPPGPNWIRSRPTHVMQCRTGTSLPLLARSGGEVRHYPAGVRILCGSPTVPGRLGGPGTGLCTAGSSGRLKGAPFDPRARRRGAGRLTGPEPGATWECIRLPGWWRPGPGKSRREKLDLFRHDVVPTPHSRSGVYVHHGRVHRRSPQGRCAD